MASLAKIVSLILLSATCCLASEAGTGKLFALGHGGGLANQVAGQTGQVPALPANQVDGTTNTDMDMDMGGSSSVSSESSEVDMDTDTDTDTDGGAAAAGAAAAAAAAAPAAPAPAVAGPAPAPNAANPVPVLEGNGRMLPHRQGAGAGSSGRSAGIAFAVMGLIALVAVTAFFTIRRYRRSLPTQHV